MKVYTFDSYTAMNLLVQPFPFVLIWLLYAVQKCFQSACRYLRIKRIAGDSSSSYVLNKSAILFAVGPLDVKILGSNQPLSAGRRYDLLCQSSGSRPPASITWWKGENRLEKTKETVSPNSVQHEYFRADPLSSGNTGNLYPNMLLRTAWPRFFPPAYGFLI